MIYEFPDITAPIRQGDIFLGLPRIDISLNKILVVTDTGERIANWTEVAQKGEPVNIIVPVRPVAAIVATQDCDAIRGRDITLCEIREFTDVERKANEKTSPKGWKNIITQHARINQKWFYLPPDDRLGFNEKMAVDFMVTLRVPRYDLEEMRNLRKGRLNAIAEEHFRERIGEFFRRYPYDEWYPLNQDELKIYMNEYPATQPFPWQEVEILGSGTKS
jgi:antitoxin (DNA-binding transcriptional repressor) of toxin-antitoxin stability system